MDLIRKYYIARIGINHVLWITEEKIGIDLNGVSLNSISEIIKLQEMIYDHRFEFQSYNFKSIHLEMIERDPKMLTCKDGITSNMLEFFDYIIRQRRTNDIDLKGYDQGYLSRKSGEYSAAPWVLSFGPVAVMALTHCCANDAKFPKNIRDFCEHLEAYGISISTHDLAEGNLGVTMRNLGIILDSPDAEGGMMITSPFSSSEREEK